MNKLINICVFLEVAIKTVGLPEKVHIVIVVCE